MVKSKLTKPNELIHIEEIICKGFQVIVQLNEGIYAFNNCRLEDYISPFTGETINLDRLKKQELSRLESWEKIYDSIGLILSENTENINDSIGLILSENTENYTTIIEDYR